MKDQRICYIKHYPEAMRSYLFDCTDIEPPLELGESVICDTALGQAAGTVVTIMTGQVKQIIAQSEASLPLKKVIERQDMTLVNEDDLPF